MGKNKKSYKYIWLALFFLILFLIPILNVAVFLPLGMFFSIKQMRLTKEKPKEYGGFGWALLILINSMFSFLISLIILINSIG